MIDHVAGVSQQAAATALGKAKQRYEFPKTARGEDCLALSSDVMRVRSDPASAARLKKISAIRAELNAGTYLTPQKIDRALDRALDELAQ
ncbi:hypothetical protein FACS1894139_09140 [Planctomycetales bacterium]|nr:hypothetical protein FACS1894107_11810 [Planctomycetales bacterium]GHS98090.1 hypothetical protein FACS1894108_05610 [Planctomycetales bacterium]GHT05393.1 hypothetical protein FACS1894139_09140 [Planctomycetales bacterium]